VADGAASPLWKEELKGGEMVVLYLEVSVVVI
jgi:hypothetical protein